MYKIGLTGGIASGKSTVLAWLKAHDVKAVDTDIIAREVVAPGSDTLQHLVKIFGYKILNDDGTMNREIVASIVFHDKKALEDLNAIMHQAIKSEMYRKAELLQRFSEEAIVFDVPLLIETDWHKEMDEVWLVYVEPHKQLERLCLRDGMTEADALARISSQMPMSEKLSFADVVIDNNGTQSELLAQLDALWLEKAHLFSCD